jgi:hypothetical protein
LGCFQCPSDGEVLFHASTPLRELISIRPRSTDRHQPLNRRILENLKSRAGAKFKVLWMRDPGHELILLAVVEILLDMWNEIPGK